MERSSTLTEIKKKSYADRFAEFVATRRDGEVVVGGQKFFVRNGLFPGNHLTEFLIKKMPGTLAGLRVADIGTGPGFLAIFAALRGANKVVAGDISTHVCGQAQENVRHYHLASRIQVVESDLWQKVEGQFDYVFAHLPITAEGFAIQRRFLEGLKDHLSPGGICLLAYASFGDTAMEPEIVRSHPLLRAVHTTQILGPEYDDTVWKVYEFVREEPTVEPTVLEVGNH